MSPTEIYIILVIAGLMLIGAEIFMPGGILGTLGGIALVIAIVIGFREFGPVKGGYSALAIVLMIGVAMLLWIKVFPKTGIGRSMTASKNLADSKATEFGIELLVGKAGIAASDLRPAGFATIEDKRVDVVTQGEMIQRGSHVKVVAVESNHVIVATVEDEPEAEEATS
jgi:membrane-bound ClpP family serine protease